MKHKQYEEWVFEEVNLTSDQQKELCKHLDECQDCSHLRASWMASKNLLENASLKTPAPGFTLRWQDTLVRKQRAEKIRQYRFALFGFLMIAFIAAVTYLVLSGSFMQLLANSFNGLSQILIGITNSLSTLGYWLHQVPVYIPLTLGFILFGLLNAFLMVSLFMLWNLINRKKLAHEAAKK